MNSIQVLESFIIAVNEYLSGRLDAVRKGLESVELSALLLEKYGYGIIKAAQILEISDSNRLYKELDSLLLTIDPNVKENRRIRYTTAPTDLKFGLERLIS
jgi:hypothetical protein